LNTTLRISSISEEFTQWPGRRRTFYQAKWTRELITSDWISLSRFN